MKIHDTLSDLKYYYIVLDSFFGCDLYEYIHTTLAFDERWLSTLVQQILLVFERSHKHNLFH
jgi:hypothetical protein